MQTVQLTLISTKKGQRWWAFKQMRLAHPKITSIHAPDFYKMLGSGAGSGFSIFPSFSRFALLTVFPSAEMKNNFWRENPFASELKQRTNLCHIGLIPAKGKGTWSGHQPFDPNPNALNGNEKLAIITRASIKKRYWPVFWSMVPFVVRQILKQPGLQFAVGVGELPLIEQATFTIWDDTNVMLHAAYQKKQHKKAVHKTRTLGWFSEEMFFRFSLAGIEFDGDHVKKWKQLYQIEKNLVSI